MDLGRVLNNILIRPIARIGKGIVSVTNDTVYGKNYKARAAFERRLAELRARALEESVVGAAEDRELRREDLRLRRLRDEAAGADDLARAEASRAQLAGLKAAAKRRYGATPVGEEMAIGPDGSETARPLFMPEEEQLAQFQADLLEAEQNRKASESESLIEARQARAEAAATGAETGTRLADLRAELYRTIGNLNMARTREIGTRGSQGSGPVRSRTVSREHEDALRALFRKGDIPGLMKRAEADGLDTLTNTFGSDSALVETIRAERAKAKSKRGR